MKRVVVGQFESLDRAKAVVHDLAAMNISADAISLISRVVDAEPVDGVNERFSSTVKDAKTGAFVGGIAGLLLGLSPILIPGVGPALVGGWLFATLAGATFGGLTGSFGGALIDAGVESDAAHRYTDAVHRGDTIVIVRTYPETENEIVAIMERDGAVEVHERTAGVA